MSQSHAPALRLSTIVPERPTVEINKKLYGMALPSEFGVRDEKRLRTLMHKASELRAIQIGGERELTEEETAGLAFVLDDGVRMVLPDLDAALLELPPIHGGLSDEHKLAIMQAFTATVSAKAPPTPVAPPVASAPTSSIGESYFQNLQPHIQESVGGTG